MASSLDKIRALEQLRHDGNARVVLAIYDDAVHVACRADIASEDLRQELITAANRVTRHIGRRKERA